MHSLVPNGQRSGIMELPKYHHWPTTAPFQLDKDGTTESVINAVNANADRQDGARTAPMVADAAVQSEDTDEEVPDLLEHDGELDVPRHDIGDQALIDQVARDLDLQQDTEQDEDSSSDEEEDDTADVPSHPLANASAVAPPAVQESPPIPRPPEKQSARIAAGARAPNRYRAYRTSVKKGLEEHGPHAYKVIVAELKQLIQEKKTMRPVDRGEVTPTALKKVTRSFILLKTKFDGMGRFDGIKARLVANDGAQQDRKLYDNISSPTAMMESILMCLTIAAKK
jgi:hypothetical protein